MLCQQCSQAGDLLDAALAAKRIGADDTGTVFWAKAYEAHCRGKCYCRCQMEAYE